MSRIISAQFYHHWHVHEEKQDKIINLTHIFQPRAAGYTLFTLKSINLYSDLAQEDIISYTG